MNWYLTFRPILYLLSPETAHQFAIWLLKYELMPSTKSIDAAALKTRVCGIDFESPLGVAAGFDKNAEAFRGLLNQGVSFVEVGTCTPKPQPGNPKPRLFRLESDEAIINRLGFNNKGVDYFVQNLAIKRPGEVVGANIGKNKDSTQDDYVNMLGAVYDFCDYVTINISSPNTPGLRALQDEGALDELLSNLKQARKDLIKKYSKNVPLFLKIAPDITSKQREHIVEQVLLHEIDALIISNTTINHRQMLSSTHAKEPGGLSGKPLFEPSTYELKEVYRLSRGAIPLIGVGGIFSGKDAYQKIKSGASLVQLYSALVYYGPGLINRILNELNQLLEKDGYRSVKDAVGSDVNI